MGMPRDSLWNRLVCKRSRVRGLMALALSSLAAAHAADSAPGAAPPAPANTSDAMQAHTSPTDRAAAQPEILKTIPLPQDPPPQPQREKTPQVLESVVVTAQKIQQSVKEVPISMSVIDSRFLAAQGVVDLQQAMLFVPNVKVESAGFFSAPRARGFSFNNNNKAFEPPLGLAMDGVPYTNTTYFNAGVFDIKRIEVLRGPQGTTFGKNTTAGVIDMVTNDPGGQYRGYLDLQGGEIGHRHVEGAVGGPIVKGAIEFRVAGVIDKQGGFISNTTAQTNPAAAPDFGGYGHVGFRAKLRFPDIFDSSLKLSFENVALTSAGTGAQMWHVADPVKAFILQYDPNANFDKDNYKASLDGPDYRNARVRTWLAQWERGFGPWNVVALGGYSVLTQSFAVDTDFTPVPALNGTDADKSPTTTVELRGERPHFAGLFGLKDLFGLDLGESDLLVGVFAQRREITDSNMRFVFNDVPFLGLQAVTLATSTASQAGLPPLGLPTIGIIPPPLFTALPIGPQDDVTQFFDQKGNVLAIYGQSQWRFLPRWTLQTGLRLSKEWKTGMWNQVFNSPPPNALLLAAGLQQFSATQSIAETQYQPKISLGYELTDKISTYAHWAMGFKGGGFNAFAFTGAPDQLDYMPEIAREWGIDLKTAQLPGAVRFDLSLYRMDVANFQVLGRIKGPTTIGLGVTKVFNAPKARAQGAEGDFMWKPLPGLTLIGTMGLNYTRYVDFPNNECPASSNASTCDATGKPFAFAPRWDNTLTPMYELPLPFAGLYLNSSFTVEHESKALEDVDLDPQKTQPTFFRYRATLGLGNHHAGWSFQVVGTNLSNVATSIRMGEEFPNLFVNIQNPSRVVFGQFRWTY